MKSSNSRPRLHLKKLAEQVMVITGATSGIGLATARAAARRGARLVLVARNEDALQRLGDELRARGAKVLTLVADVGNKEEVERVDQAVQEQFGGFDTWVNNAAVSMYGSLLDVPIEDERQLFETNYWGMVHGSRVAARRLQHRGGAIINVASTNADTSAPLQGTYSASEHAIKGYTDALRMELEAENAPVAVTLVKPGPIDTPFTRHARKHMDKSPRLTPPVYAPDIVADAILFCAEHPRRGVTIGAGSKVFAMASKVAPRMTEKVMSRLGWKLQRGGEARQATGDSLYQPGEDLEERGNYPGRVMESSLYTRAALHPKRTGALILASGVVAGLLWRAHRRRNGHAHGHHLADGGSRAARTLADAGHALERKLERKGRKAAKKTSGIARSIRHGIERNLPHH
ncbi:MAG TPA: SDR family oxidoreductase [Gammaproteobacteria bacterium]